MTRPDALELLAAARPEIATRSADVLDHRERVELLASIVSSHVQHPASVHPSTLGHRVAQNRHLQRSIVGTCVVLAVLLPLLIFVLLPFGRASHPRNLGAGATPVPAGTAYSLLIPLATGSIERISIGTSPTNGATSASSPSVIQQSVISGLPSAGTIAVASGTDTAYVGSRFGDNNTLTPINLKTGAMGHPIGLGAHTPGPIAISPSGKTAYVLTGGLDNTVLVVDLSSGTVTDTITVGSLPSAIAISPDGETAYISSWVSAGGGSTVPGQLDVIDLSTDTVKANVPVGRGPEGVALSPDGQVVFVSNSDSDSVTAINTKTDSIVATIPVGHIPKGIAFDPAGKYAYVVNTGQNYPGPNTVTPIQIATLTAGAPIAVAPYSSQIAISPDGGTAFVLGGTGIITPIDLTTNTPDTQIPLGTASKNEVGDIAIAPVS